MHRLALHLEALFIYKLINVTKSYDKKVNVLNNINLSFPNVGFVSILGKSGSGKSTLLNLLTGIDKPTSGQVIFKNKNINKLNDKAKKKYQNKDIGILFQHFNLFEELSCLDNIIIPSLINGDSKEESIKKAKELLKKYKLEYLTNQTYKTLSGGEKQRIALIRALINSPSIIIADEPTGALDSSNSELIVQELKELSKDHLVIVVTHNEALISKYEDYRISIKEGKCSSLNIDVKDFRNDFSKNKKVNFNLVKSFLKLHFKKHKVRNIISLSAISFSSLCLLMSFGYINGSSNSINNYSKKSLQYGMATIAKKTIVDIPGSPIKISKLTRPEETEINFLKEDIPSVVVTNNYQAVFPSYPTFIFDNKTVDDIEFSPIYDFNNYSSLLTKGSFPNNDEFIEVVVNEEFANHFNYSSNDIINLNLELSDSIDVINYSDKHKSIKDKIEYKNKLKIKGVVKEFSYLNTPRVYYSYLGLEDYLSTIILSNYSAELEFEISAKEIVEFADNKESNSGYSYNIFVNNLNEVDKLFKYKDKFDKNNEFDITSNSYTIINSYSSMTNIISKSLIVFIVIALLGTIFIVSISSYANYTINKKESAILSILGLDRKSLFLIFALENILVASISLAISLLLSKPIEILFNVILNNNFHLENLIAIPYLSFIPLLIILGIVLISILSTFIPFIFYEKNYIVEELKDE